MKFEWFLNLEKRISQTSFLLEKISFQLLALHKMPYILKIFLSMYIRFNCMGCTDFPTNRIIFHIIKTFQKQLNNQVIMSTFFFCVRRRYLQDVCDLNVMMIFQEHLVTLLSVRR